MTAWWSALTVWQQDALLMVGLAAITFLVGAIAATFFGGAQENGPHRPTW